MTSSSSSSSSSCPHQLDLLPLVLGRDAGGGRDAQALLEHGHARLGLAALDLGQPRALLRLLVLQLLRQPLVVAVHLLHLLPSRRGGGQNKVVYVSLLCI